MNIKDKKIIAEWINVKDRLPDTKGCVLFHDNTGVTYKGWLATESKCWFIDTSELSVDGDACICDDDIDMEYVTYWQPLPEPPKEES